MSAAVTVMLVLQSHLSTGLSLSFHHLMYHLHLFRIHSPLGISLISQHVPPGVCRISQTTASHATLDTSSIMQLLGLNGFVSSLRSEDGWVELTDQQCVMVSC